MNSYLTGVECPRCGTRYDAGRPQNLWRYRELLPVGDAAHIATLGEGWTPLLPAARYGARIGVSRLLVKDEGLVPTGSFKARGAAVGVSRASEFGIRHVAMPTNGNAGAAWAVYAAPAGLRATRVPSRGRTRLWLCPEAAAGLTAARALRASGWLGADEEVVVLNTGSGRKHPDSVET